MTTHSRPYTHDEVMRLHRMGVDVNDPAAVREAVGILIKTGPAGTRVVTDSRGVAVLVAVRVPKGAPQ